MEKPLQLLIEEGRTKIIQTINETRLPAFLLEPILKEIYIEISSNKKNDYYKLKNQYEKSLIEKKTEKFEDKD